VVPSAAAVPFVKIVEALDDPGACNNSLLVEVVAEVDDSGRVGIFTA
jgi:hypothetical protein